MTKSALSETYDWLRKLGSGVKDTIKQTPLYKNPKQTLEQAVYSALPAVGAYKAIQQSPRLQQATRQSFPIANTKYVGQQLQRVNLPTFNVPSAIKAGFPITQIPEQINTQSQSYGRTLSDPRKQPLESALNIGVFIPIGGTIKSISRKLAPNLERRS